MTNNSNPMFMSPQALAQAATAAFAAAAQQVAQQQASNKQNNQGLMFQPNSNMVNRNDSSETRAVANAPGNQPSQVGSNMNTNVPEALTSMIQSAQAFASNPNQMALNAQAAAVLAAGGINPSLLLNAGNGNSNNINPTIAAAQAIASFMQSQQQQQNTQVSQAMSNNNLSNSAQHFNDQQNSNAQNNQSNQTSASVMQHFNHKPQAQATQPSLLKSMNNQVNDLSNGDALSSLLSMNTKSSNRGKTMNQNVASLLQNGNTNSAANISPQQQHQPDSNINSLYATAANNPVFFAQMQNWKLDQLETHCHLLREANQPIPQQVALLLAEARRREDKKNAKRVANRKSACTSRARKKAFVEEMTRMNARLKRQAVILSLLPDLVIAINLDGTITFCSAQVGRVLRHDVDKLVGVDINKLLIANSRKDLARLIHKLATAEKAALEENNNKETDESGRSSNSGNQSTAAVVSESSEQGYPPLSVVKVNRSHKSYNINSNNRSSTTTNSNSKPTHTDDVTGATVTANNAEARLSSLQHKPEGKKSSDEVTGTAAPMDSALNSLQHKQDKKSSKGPGSNFESQEDVSSSTSTDSLLNGVEDKRKSAGERENGSDDSGYRESGESTSRDTSSTSDTSNGGRPRPLAPTCNICLIRNDNSTIWCEVTSSIRTRSVNEENTNSTIGASSDKKKGISGNSSSNGEVQVEDEQIKELLLCLRPIRDGNDNIDEKPKLSAEIRLNEEGGKENGSNDTNDSTKKLSKKRSLSQEEVTQKDEKRITLKKSGNEAEKSVVESLILMSSHKRQKD